MAAVFAALWLAVVLLGLGIVFFVMPLGLGWSIAAVLLGIVGILVITRSGCSKSIAGLRNVSQFTPNHRLKKNTKRK